MEVIATNITSPLGRTTEENYVAVRQGQSALRICSAGSRGVPFDFCAAVFDAVPQFEELAYSSAAEALSHTVGMDLRRTVFILSSTKGVIDEPMGVTATRIARRLGIEEKPVVVCNACISGLSAQILADRLLATGVYDSAVITGVDVLTDFIISGFQSLKALSAQQCRPFDIERLGLNLGEAAATMVVVRDKKMAKGDGDFRFRTLRCSTHNDAWHVTNPHPKGEGAYRSLLEVGSDDVACIGVHGTATMFNDQMESMAIVRAQMIDVPLSALKGYYGHTLGAAGLLETIITARALHDGVILANEGFSVRGVSGKVNIQEGECHTDGRCFVKMMSGFGGCNAAIAYQVGDDIESGLEREGAARLDVPTVQRRETVRHNKMDVLGKCVYDAVEQLIAENRDNLSDDDIENHLSLIIFNKTSSVVSDRKYQATISDVENYYPSPSVFVYTLPNVALGEIAVRYGIHGETSLYILPERDEAVMRSIVEASLNDNDTRYVITGWVDCPDENNRECDLKIVKRQ